MAAVNALITRDAIVHQLARRQNWAAQEPGVIVVFCIVGIVLIGVLGLGGYRLINRRRLAKQSVV